MSDAAVAETYSPLPSITQPIWVASGRMIQVLIAFAPLIFFVCLGAMLFRPPDLPFVPIDHAGLVLLVVAAALRILVLRKPLSVPRQVTLPLVCVVVLSLASIVSQPFEPENWSVWLAKWVVPLVFFVLAGQVFETQQQVRQLEIFLLVVLGYLVLTALLFVFDLKWLIFPRYILDDSLGIHADRARGPFLQAVANGMTINILAVLAIDSFRRNKLPGLTAIILLAGIPLAIFATLTRAVWFCFGISIAALAFLSRDRRVRNAVLGFALTGVIAVFLFLTCSSSSCRYGDRLEERGPVDFRIVMFRTGLEMFLEKPLTGWEASAVQPELADRIVDFHQRQYFFHNTYLEIAVYQGLIGLALYLWLVFDLFRVGSIKSCSQAAAPGAFLDKSFRRIWPVILAVYLINAGFVVMNYQFVNAVLFSLAGLLAAQNRTRAFNGIRLLPSSA